MYYSTTIREIRICRQFREFLKRDLNRTKKIQLDFMCNSRETNTTIIYNFLFDAEKKHLLLKTIITISSKIFFTCNNMNHDSVWYSGCWSASVFTPVLKPHVCNPIDHMIMKCKQRLQ